MGKSTISMAIFNSYFDITRVYRYDAQKRLTLHRAHEALPSWCGDSDCVAEGYGWSHIKCGFPAKVDHDRSWNRWELGIGWRFWGRDRLRNRRLIGAVRNMTCCQVLVGTRTAHWFLCCLLQVSALLAIRMCWHDLHKRRCARKMLRI